MSVRELIPEAIAEKTTRKLSAVVKDETGVAIPAAQLTTLTLTLYALDSGLTIINSRNATNILNANGGTVDSSGNLAFTMTPDDNAIVDSTQAEEIHIILLQWTYASGTKAGRQEIEFRVRNLAKVP